MSSAIRAAGCGGVLAGRSLRATAPGRGRRLHEGHDVAVLSIGTIGNFAAAAVARAEAEGLSVAHYDLRYCKPLDLELLHEVGRSFRSVVTVEDGAVCGGVGQAVTAFFNAHGYPVRVRSLGIGDTFVEHGTPTNSTPCAATTPKAFIMR